MKYIVILSTVITFGLLFSGLYFDFQDNPMKHKMYGLGTISLFFITFPLFLFWRKNKITMDKYIWKNPNKKVDDKDEI